MSSQNAWRPVDAASETLNLAASFRWREHRERFPRTAAALDFVFRALSSSESSLIILESELNVLG
jgi:hypothetical protein